MFSYIRILSLSLAMVVPVSSGLAASKTPKLARCDGKHRRPANIYGSILPSVDPASGSMTPASATTNGVDLFRQGDPTKPKTKSSKHRRGEEALPQVPPISAIAPPSAFGSC
jgi:hypothetical protein